VLVAGLSAAPASADAALGDRKLKQGHSGGDVRTLQAYLTRVGVTTEADGRFGPATAASVRDWETRSAFKTVNEKVSPRNARKLKRQVRHGVSLPQSTVLAAPAPVPAGDRAVLGPDGKAIAPATAPAAVKAAIDAANRISDKPYRYGGGHGRWEDSGYDCSGAMSYVLHGAGLLDSPLTSGGFMSYGERGAGAWITSYAHGGHGYLVIAGLRFDTGWNNAGKGPRWSEELRPTDGYTVRHPAGL